MNTAESVLGYSLLKEGEVSGLTGITNATLKQWRSLKKGPSFVKLEGMIFYRSDKLSEWIQESEVVTSPAGG